MASDTSTTDTSTATDTPVVTADSNVHEITLDVKKSGQTINEPIVIRTDDTDDVIKVHLKKDGQPYTGITSATFYGTKQDLTIIANDPAYVKDDIITYFVPKEVANIGGKIKDAYFMIDGKISTENFEITVIKTVKLLGESKDYIPGLNNLIDKWNDTSLDWTKKLKDIDQAVANIDADKMINDKMNTLLETAKTDYMATFNKSVDDLNNVVKDLTSKEDVATDKGKELDDAIAKVNQSISDVNAWLVEVQNKITTANKEFTDAQRKSVSDVITQLKATIADTQKTADNLGTQLTTINDNIRAINVPDLNASVKKANDTADSANTTANNAIAKFANLQTQVNDSAVGTNLLTGTSYDLQTAPPSQNNTMGGFIYNFSSDELSSLAGNQVTARAFIHNTTPHTVNLLMWTNHGGVNVGTDVPAGTDGYSTITNYSIRSGNTMGNISIRAYTENTTISGVQYKELKLEKGSVATDWCPNPSEIATNDDVQTAITNALGNYSTTAEVDSKISTGVGQAKTYAEQSIKDIIGAAPDTLDTIAELADAVTKNKDGVQAINDGITKKADKTDVTALQNTVQTMITTISQADYDALVSAGTVDPKILYVIPDA